MPGIDIEYRYRYRYGLPSHHPWLPARWHAPGIPHFAFSKKFSTAADPFRVVVPHIISTFHNLTYFYSGHIHRHTD